MRPFDCQVVVHVFPYIGKPERNKQPVLIPNARFITLAAEPDENSKGYMNISAAVCNPSDNFRRKVGYHKATGRLKALDTTNYYTESLDVIVPADGKSITAKDIVAFLKFLGNQFNTKFNGLLETNPKSKFTDMFNSEFITRIIADYRSQFQGNESAETVNSTHEDMVETVIE